MSLNLLKSYSTKAFGYVKYQPGRVAMYLPRAQDQMDIFASLKQKDRPAVLEKIETSILREQLNATKRNMVFRESLSLISDENLQQFSMVVGNTQKQIELTLRKYMGPPSRQDLRTIILTSHTTEDVIYSTNLIQQCLRSKNLSTNFDNEMLSALLRRAANAGVFQDVFHHLTTNRNEFSRHLQPPFYLEALRLYALRVPYLSHRSKNTLNRLWTKAGPLAGRDFCYAFGLAQYKKKFGAQHQGHLNDAINSIQKFVQTAEATPRELYKAISLPDLVMGYEALQIADNSGKEELISSLENLLTNLSRNRPLRETLTVTVTEQPEDGSAVDDGAESSGKSSE